MTAIVFPSSPVAGQEFVASNGATYIFSGSYWSSTTAIEDGSAAYIYEGGYATETYNEIFDNTLDGGDANGNQN